MQDSDFVILAVVGAPHGIRGEVRVKSYSTDPMALRAYRTLFAEDGRSFTIESMRPAKNLVIAKFRGVEDRDAAAKLTGFELGIARSALPPPDEDEFYHADLIGLEAFDAEGHSLGHVVAVQNYGAGDILEIAPPKLPSTLIPFTRANVPDIDVAAGRLVVAPPTEVEIEPSEEDQ